MKNQESDRYHSDQSHYDNHNDRAPQFTDWAHHDVHLDDPHEDEDWSGHHTDHSAESHHNDDPHTDNEIPHQDSHSDDPHKDTYYVSRAEAGDITSGRMELMSNRIYEMVSSHQRYISDVLENRILRAVEERLKRLESAVFGKAEESQSEAEDNPEGKQ